MRLILASSSPRRREILALLGAPFEVVEPGFEERLSDDVSIEKEVLDFAIGKAQAVARLNANGIVIGSDTMIGINAEKIGKPIDQADAARILRLLSGKTHRIFTSVAIIDSSGPGIGIVEKVAMVMRPYTEPEIERYLRCGESLDKAGAYSIQGKGRTLIASIEGDYLAAVGLPLKPVALYLKSRGVSFPLDIERFYAEKSYMNWKSFA